jgi:alkylhydroperoxidase/carboxymuconolactone decarboxylase family protein YurZ
MNDDYEKGYAQFARMVGEENIEQLTARFRAVCPDFETEVVSVVGGRFWTRDGIDLKTRSLCSICVLAALGRNNALKLNLQMALRNGRASRKSAKQSCRSPCMPASLPLGTPSKNWKRHSQKTADCLDDAVSLPTPHESGQQSSS